MIVQKQGTSALTNSDIFKLQNHRLDPFLPFFHVFSSICKKNDQLTRGRAHNARNAEVQCKSAPLPLFPPRSARTVTVSRAISGRVVRCFGSVQGLQRNAKKGKQKSEEQIEEKRKCLKPVRRPKEPNILAPKELV